MGKKKVMDIDGLSEKEREEIIREIVGGDLMEDELSMNCLRDIIMTMDNLIERYSKEFGGDAAISSFLGYAMGMADVVLRTRKDLAENGGQMDKLQYQATRGMMNESMKIGRKHALLRLALQENKKKAN